MQGRQADYARHIGKSRAYVHKLVKQGKIPIEAGKIDFQMADQALGQVKDPARAMVTEVAAPAPGTVPQADAGPSFSRARIARETYQAKLAQLELERRQGQVLDRAGIEEGMVEGARIIRRRLDSIPNRAEEVDAAARQGGAPAVRLVLRKLVREVQQTMADDLTDRMSKIASDEA